MKAVPDKCHFICSTNDTVNLLVENQIINNSKCEKFLGVKFDQNQIINNSKCEKFLGVKFDYKLAFFNAHIDDICKKTGLKLNASSRIRPYNDNNNGYQ